VGGGEHRNRRYLRRRFLEMIEINNDIFYDAGATKRIV
jgi:hypothetical protein